MTAAYGLYADWLEDLRRELAESLERENATNDILRMIATATGDLQHLLDAIAERAARLCDSIDAQILSLDGEGHWVVASYGPISVNPRQERVPLAARQVNNAVALAHGVHPHLTFGSHLLPRAAGPAAPPMWRRSRPCPAAR